MQEPPNLNILDVSVQAQRVFLSDRGKYSLESVWVTLAKITQRTIISRSPKYEFGSSTLPLSPISFSFSLLVFGFLCASPEAHSRSFPIFLGYVFCWLLGIILWL